MALEGDAKALLVRNKPQAPSPACPAPPRLSQAMHLILTSTHLQTLRDKPQQRESHGPLPGEAGESTATSIIRVSASSPFQTALRLYETEEALKQDQRGKPVSAAKQFGMKQLTLDSPAPRPRTLPGAVSASTAQHA